MTTNWTQQGEGCTCGPPWVGHVHHHSLFCGLLVYRYINMDGILGLVMCAAAVVTGFVAVVAGVT